MAQKLKHPCKARTEKKCSLANKSCKWTTGKKRRYCRRTRNTLKRFPKKSVEVMYSDVYSKSENIPVEKNPLK